MSQVYPLQAISDLARAFADAEHHLPRIYQNDRVREPFDFAMWTQQWSDTSCGFGGIAGQAFTAATVFIGWREHGSDAAVYIGGGFAYPVRAEDPRCADFWRRVATTSVLGAVEWLRGCKHVLALNSNVCERCGRGQPVAPVIG